VRGVRAGRRSGLGRARAEDASGAGACLAAPRARRLRPWRADGRAGSGRGRLQAARPWARACRAPGSRRGRGMRPWRRVGQRGERDGEKPGGGICYFVTLSLGLLYFTTRPTNHRHKWFQKS
jgi:hypothetical protein